jgi:hypothetical protein
VGSWTPNTAVPKSCCPTEFKAVWGDLAASVIDRAGDCSPYAEAASTGHLLWRAG